MKSPVMSAKERTKIKFEQLIKDALQDSKLGLSDFATNEEKKVEKVPLKPMRKYKKASSNVLEENVRSANGSDKDEVKDVPNSELLNAVSDKTVTGSHEEVQTSILGKANSAKLQQRIIQADVHRTAKPSVIEVNASSGMLDKNLSPPSKTNHREHRRRQKHLQNMAYSENLVSKVERDVSNETKVTSQLKSTNDYSHGESSTLQDDAGYRNPSTEITDSSEMNSGFGVTIYRADRLKMNFKIKHPLVRVYVVDGTTGSYLKKSRKDRLVTAVYENRNSNVDFIMPVMTQPCDLNTKRTMFPVWEETLLYNESFNHFTNQESNVIIFFEILDFLPMSFLNTHKTSSSQDGSWYRIAWAFLKVVGANNKSNCGRKLQLQLFYTPKGRIRPEPNILDVFQWWSQLPRISYPATLYVTLTCLSPLKVLSPALRSMAPTQEERGSNSINLGAERYPNSSNDNQEAMQVMAGNSKSAVEWSRLPGQSCKVPNTQILSLRTTKNGCFVGKFSNDGRLVACGCKNETASVIFIYEIPSGLLVSSFHGHTGIIYDINWSTLDDLLLSASADGTARIWRNLNDTFSEAKQLMPHPSFVYCSNFHPKHNSIVVTGSYDGFVRVWFVQSLEENPHLSQELEGHCGHVNTLCFDQDGLKLFSGDNKGVICVWNVEKNIKNQGDSLNWTLFYKIEDQELKTSISITALIHHPNMQRILVQSLDGSLRMLDYTKRHYLQTYSGCLNLRVHLRGCISPCGGLVFAGSEDGRVHVWNSITGDVMATYSNLSHRQTIRCITFHPHDHMIAFCYYGKNTPVIIYKYNSQVITSKPVATETLYACSKPLMSFNMPHLQESTLTSTASTCLEKVMSQLDSVLKSSAPTQDRKSLEAIDSTKTFHSTVTSWDTTFDTFSSVDGQAR